MQVRSHDNYVSVLMCYQYSCNDDGFVFYSRRVIIYILFVRLKLMRFTPGANLEAQNATKW